MGYLVVTGADKKSGTFHVVAVDPQNFNVIGDYGMMRQENIVQILRSGDSVAPLNFSVNREGQLIQNCGDFSRFSQRGSAVVLAEIKSRGGRTLGYRLLSCANNMCVNLRVEEVLQREKAMNQGEHFLQNGIIRNNTVNCYPMRPFHILTVDTPVKQSKPPVPKPAKPMQAPVITDKGAFRPKPMSQRAPMSAAQSKEAELCRQRGVSPKLIDNPELTPEQMRILWVSKSKGCMAESFADPRFSADSMKFYADRLYDKKTVDECKDMLAHPELEVDQLNELYACVCQGVPYSDMIGMSATDISVKREMAVSEYWGSSSQFDPDYLEKAANVARRLHSGQ